MRRRLADPGLAGERTELAWQRYALVLAVIAALAIRAGLHSSHQTFGFVVAFVLSALALVVQLFGPGLPPRTATRLVLAVSLTAALGALLLALA